MEDNKPKRIVIEMDDFDSNPRLFLDGKEIEGKMKIHFSWMTKSDIDGGFDFCVKHYDTEVKPFLTKTIEYRRGIL